jgi:hypothetical protein
MQVGKRLALFSIQKTDLTSFSEDERGVKWLCNETKPNPTPTLTPNCNSNPNPNPNRIDKKVKKETTSENR